MLMVVWLIVKKKKKNIIFKTASEHAFTYSLAAIIYKKKPYLMKR